MGPEGGEFGFMGGASGRDLAWRQQQKDQIRIGHGVLQVFMDQPFP